jgi:DNA repair exonuclease SbcCD ATPase subunit
MSDERADPGSDAESMRIEEAQQRLDEATAAAEAAKEQVTAKVRALEADLEREKLSSAEALESLRERLEHELDREREAKEQAIAAAQERLAEIETHAEAAETRVEDAERRAKEAEARIADAQAGAREAAASWLREQVTAIRREAAGQ